MPWWMKFVYDAHSRTVFRHQAARINDALAWCFSLNSGILPDRPLQGLIHKSIQKKLHKDEKFFGIIYKFVAEKQKK